MESITTPVILISILLLLAAAIFSIVLANRSRGPGLAWLFIAFALLLMAGKGAATLAGLALPGLGLSGAGPVGNLVSLVVAIVLVVGVLQVPQLFRDQQEENERLHSDLAHQQERVNNLEAAGRRLEQALDQLPGLLLVGDDRGVVQVVRGQGKAGLGPTPDWAVGRPVVEVYGYAPWLRDSVERALLGQHSAIRGVHNGQPVRAVFTPLDESSRWSGGFVGLAVPVEEGDEAPLAVRARQPTPAMTGAPGSRLNQQFMAMASQELSGPLAGLARALRGLAAGDGEPDGATHAVAEADRQYRRLAQRLTELFELSQPAPAAASPSSVPLMTGVSDLSVLLFKVAERLEPEAARNRSPLLIQAPLPVIGPWKEADLERLVMALLSRSLEAGAGRPVEVLLSLEREVAHLIVRSYGGRRGNAPPALEGERSMARGFGGELHLNGDGARGFMATVYLPVAPAEAGVPLPVAPREVG